MKPCTWSPRRLLVRLRNICSQPVTILMHGLPVPDWPSHWSWYLKLLCRAKHGMTACDNPGCGEGADTDDTPGCGAGMATGDTPGYRAGSTTNMWHPSVLSRYGRRLQSWKWRKHGPQVTPLGTEQVVQLTCDTPQCGAGMVAGYNPGSGESMAHRWQPWVQRRHSHRWHPWVWSRQGRRWQLWVWRRQSRSWQPLVRRRHNMWHLGYGAGRATGDTLGCGVGSTATGDTLSVEQVQPKVTPRVPSRHGCRWHPWLQCRHGHKWHPCRSREKLLLDLYICNFAIW